MCDCILDRIPLCAVGENRLPEECAAMSANGGEFTAIQKVFVKDRECKQFTPWIPVLIPKEHIDMNLLEQPRDWQQVTSQRTNEANRDKQLSPTLRACGRSRCFRYCGLVGSITHARYPSPVATGHCGSA